MKLTSTRMWSLLGVLLLINTVVFAQPGTFIVNQNFAPSTPKDYIDLSEKLIWGSNTGPTSAFQLVPKADGSSLSYNAITLTDSATKRGNYSSPTGLKTCQSIDFKLGNLSRTAGDSIVVEFDAIWDVVSNGGESGRVVVALMHETPNYDNFPFGLVDSARQIAPFGRPAYNFRVLNRRPQGFNNYAHLFYGGGKDLQGEFEKYSNPTVGAWWLPGFISMPTGLTPSSRPYYPQGPGDSYTSGPAASNTAWQHYKILLKKELATVYYRPTAGGPEQIINQMFIPKPDADTNITISRLNSFYRTTITKMPPLYQHWDTIRGLRFFFNAPDRAYISNVSVWYSGTPVGLASHVNTNTFNVWPNPVNSATLFLQCNAQTTIQLIDVLGKSVLVKEDITSGELSIDNIPNGIYQLIATQNNRLIGNKKIVISK